MKAYNYTATGRTSSSKPNAQNMPRANFGEPLLEEARLALFQDVLEACKAAGYRHVQTNSLGMIWASPSLHEPGHNPIRNIAAAAGLVPMLSGRGARDYVQVRPNDIVPTGSFDLE